jgi:hypothetical protein
MSYQPQYQTSAGNWRQLGVAHSYQDQSVAEDIAKDYAQRYSTHTRVIGPGGVQVIAYDYQNATEPEPATERKGVWQRAYTLNEIDLMRDAVALLAGLSRVPPATIEDRLRTYMMAGIAPAELIGAADAERKRREELREAARERRRIEQEAFEAENPKPSREAPAVQQRDWYRRLQLWFRQRGVGVPNADD